MSATEETGGTALRIREAQFREKLRGYHPDDVDEFLDKLALAVEELESRLADVTARLAEAESRATVAGGDEHVVRRTLALAQRAADLAVTEAQERAAAIVAAAEEEARSRIAEAEAAAVERRREAQEGLEAELARLEAACATARQELERLETRRAEERARLTEVLAELQALVERRLAPRR